MPKHWAMRPLQYLASIMPDRCEYKVLEVTKENIPPYKSDTGYGKVIYFVSLSWLQENYPIAFASFMTYMMSSSSKWNREGSLQIDPWSEWSESWNAAQAIGRTIKARDRKLTDE